MSKSRRTAQAAAQPCQHRLANDLIRELGYESALALCTSNEWVSALEMIKYEGAR